MLLFSSESLKWLVWFSVWRTFTCVTKTHIQYMNLDHVFYYIGTARIAAFYYILQVHIVVVQNSNVQGGVLNVMLYRVENTPYTNPKPKLPNSVKEGKSDIKTHLLMQLYYFNLFYTRVFRCPCRTVVSSTCQHFSSQVSKPTAWQKPHK